MSKKNDQSVLGNLPSTRPARIGRRREGASAREQAPVAATATKPKPAAKRKPAATTAKPKAAKPRPTATKPATPRAVRSGAPALERAQRPGDSVPPLTDSAPPRGTGVVTTAVQAAGELAQIGVTLGGQVAKRALKRLPKP